MLNVSMAFNILLLMVCLLIFKQLSWLSPSIFISLFCITYILLRFTSIRRFIHPTLTVHTIFLCSYAIPVITLFIAVLAAEGGANALGAAVLVFISIIPSSILLAVGILMLFKWDC